MGEDATAAIDSSVPAAVGEMFSRLGGLRCVDSLEPVSPPDASGVVSLGETTEEEVDAALAAADAQCADVLVGPLDVPGP